MVDEDAAVLREQHLQHPCILDRHVHTQLGQDRRGHAQVKGDRVGVPSPSPSPSPSAAADTQEHLVPPRAEGQAFSNAIHFSAAATARFTGVTNVSMSAVRAA